MEQLTANLSPEQLTGYALSVLGAIVIFIIGRFVAGVLRKAVRRSFDRKGTDPAVSSFVGTLVYAVVLAATILAVLSTFGIETASFIAVLGAAGFAVGFALQGSLGNFAAGVLLLIFRPFKVGDVVEVAGVLGVVDEIDLFNTLMHTPDNIKVYVPNGQIYGSTIKNISAFETRRVDMVVGIGYGSSIARAEEIINELIEADERILKDPAPTVAVAELADSSVNFVVRPWTETANYWAVKFDFTRKVKEAFDANDIEIPFPQRTVWMANDES